MIKPKILVATLLLSCVTLSACTTVTSPPASSPSASSYTESIKPNTTTRVTDEIPQYDKLATINILVTYAPFDPKTDNSVKVLEETTGFKLEYDMLPEKNALDKLNLLFSSGDILYDYISIGANDTYKSMYATYAKKNLLVDLTDKLHKYENLSKMDPMGMDAIKVDGRIYAIGSTGLPYTNNTISIRVDWLEKLGLPIPQTRDDLYNALVQFKVKDPDGVGMNLIPLIGQPATLVPTISTTFGILYDYEDRNGKIVDTRLLPEYKEYLTFMNMLYNEGLLDPDMPVNTGTTVSEKCASGMVGVYSGHTDIARSLWVAKKAVGQDGTYFDIIEPLEDSSGVKRARSLSGLFNIGMIPTNSKNPNGVLAFLDAFRDDKNYESAIHGKEGVDYTVVDGDKNPIVPDFDQNRGNLYHLKPLQDGYFYFPLWIMRTRKTLEAAVLFAKTFEVAGDYLDISVLAFTPAFDTVSQEIKVVNEYAMQEATKFIAGARSLNEFDKFIEEMNSKGAVKVIDAYNEWYVNR